jgi:hypothetical protein
MKSICSRSVGLAVLLGAAFLMAGCGSGSNSGNINGNWTATLTDPSGGAEFAFTTSLTQGSGTSVNVVNFNFTTSGTCFASTTTETGSFTLAGDFNGNVTGQLGLTISTDSLSPNNVLTLQGAVNGSKITGTWSLTGATGCSGNGTFNMSKS